VTTTSAYKQNLPKQIEAIKSFRFGVEIETVGASRQKLAEVIAKALGLGASAITHDGGTYDKWIVTLADGRKWTMMSDASLSTGRNGSAEIVTPILTYADVEMLQTVIRAAREDAKAKVDHSCGVHVHVDAASLSTPELERLAKLVYQQEDLLVTALGVKTERLTRWCKKVDENFIAKLKAERPRDQQTLASLWYGTNVDHANHRGAHYHQSRYHGLNMHSVFYRGTIEFRYFEGTLHAGEIKSYVQLCLALVARAKTSQGRVIVKRKPSTQSAKYDWRCFLLRLGLIGDEFATAREHLTKRLPGCAAWKNGRPAPQTTNEPKPEAAASMAA
jgi:Putative amidoligase enzyme